MDTTIEDVLRKFQDLTRLRYVADPQPQFVFPHDGDIPPVSVDLAYLQELLTLLSRKSKSDLTLYDQTNYEILVREESVAPFAPPIRDTLKIEDTENHLTYEVSHPSDLYILFLLDQLVQSGLSRRYIRGLPPSVLRRRLESQGKGLTIFEYVRLAGLRYPTVKITSQDKTLLKRFQSLLTAFAFQVAYNLDLAIVPQRSLLEFARGARMSMIRRAPADTIDPPRRDYLQDLVYHYQMGVAAESPFLAYLSCYHVAEHFFENVFSDELVEKVKSKITQPGFSYKRRKDITALIDDVKRAFQYRTEYVTFNEQEALRLTLTRFVPLDELKRQVKTFDDMLYNYYANEDIAFSKGPRIPWDDPDTVQVFKSLAKRIYSTRNTLVHSKESDKSKYTPFSDDKVLAMELPLLRFIAENIIVANSSLMER